MSDYVPGSVGEAHAVAQRRASRKLPTVESILHVVVSECRNGCAHEQSAFDYINRHYSPNVSETDAAFKQRLVLVLGIINFAAVRERSDELFELTRPKEG